MGFKSPPREGFASSPPPNRNSDALPKNTAEGVDRSKISRDESRQASQLSHLGLAGMYERVRLVGGQLSIESEPGKGTTVTAVFPLHPHSGAEIEI